MITHFDSRLMNCRIPGTSPIQNFSGWNARSTMSSDRRSGWYDGAPLPASIRFLLNFKVFYWLIISISTRIESSELHVSFLDAMNIVNASSRISIRLMLVSCVFLALSLDSEILGLCRRPVRPEIFETSPTLTRVQILGLQGRLT